MVTYLQETDIFRQFAEATSLDMEEAVNNILSEAVITALYKFEVDSNHKRLIFDLLSYTIIFAE